MIIRKKQILAVALVLALGTAVFVNWYYTRPGSVSTASPTVSAKSNAAEEGEELGEARYVLSADVEQGQTEDAFFAEAKLKRQTAHDEAVETLQAVIKDSASSASAVQEATAALNASVQRLETQAALENTVEAKLGVACLAVLSDENARIILQKGSLNEASAMQVQEIVQSQTAYSPQNITIIENNS